MSGYGESDEVLDVVDDQDRVIGQASRKETHARGLKHRAVHIFVFNERGELFVQKRAAGKDTFPGCYDSSSSGHVNSGEDYDACALRELREELGLDLSQHCLRKHFKISACEDTQMEFVWMYSLQGSYHPQIDHTEIESGSFCSLTRVDSLISGEAGACAFSFRKVFTEFLRRGLWPGGYSPVAI